MCLGVCVLRCVCALVRVDARLLGVCLVICEYVWVYRCDSLGVFWLICAYAKNLCLGLSA